MCKNNWPIRLHCSTAHSGTFAIKNSECNSISCHSFIHSLCVVWVGVYCVTLLNSHVCICLVRWEWYPTCKRRDGFRRRRDKREKRVIVFRDIIYTAKINNNFHFLIYLTAGKARETPIAFHHSTGTQAERDPGTGISSTSQNQNHHNMRRAKSKSMVEPLWLPL